MTSVGLELQRQLALRYGLPLPVAVADTVWYRADGLSGFNPQVSPYSFVERHDILLSGLNVTNVSSAEMILGSILSMKL